MTPFDRSYTTFYWSAIVNIFVPFFSYLTLNNIVTLKSGLEVTQGHSSWLDLTWKWYHSKALVRESTAAIVASVVEATRSFLINDTLCNMSKLFRAFLMSQVGAKSPRSGGEAPLLKLNALLFLGLQRKLQICPIIDIAKVRKLHSE